MLLSLLLSAALVMSRSCIDIQGHECTHLIGDLVVRTMEQFTKAANATRHLQAIHGDLTWQIRDTEPIEPILTLPNLRRVDGDIRIEQVGLRTFNHLFTNLQSIGGRMYINNLPFLESLENAFPNLESVLSISFAGTWRCKTKSFDYMFPSLRNISGLLLNWCEAPDMTMRYAFQSLYQVDHSISIRLPLTNITGTLNELRSVGLYPYFGIGTPELHLSNLQVVDPSNLFYNLQVVMGTISITGSRAMMRFPIFPNLTRAEEIIVSSNTVLEHLNGIFPRVSVLKRLVIQRCHIAQSMDNAFTNLTTIYGAMILKDMENMESLTNSFSLLEVVTDGLEVDTLLLLQQMDGSFTKLRSVGGPGATFVNMFFLPTLSLPALQDPLTVTTMHHLNALDVSSAQSVVEIVGAPRLQTVLLCNASHNMTTMLRVRDSGLLHCASIDRMVSGRWKGGECSDSSPQFGCIGEAGLEQFAISTWPYVADATVHWIPLDDAYVGSFFILVRTKYESSYQILLTDSDIDGSVHIPHNLISPPISIPPELGAVANVTIRVFSPDQRDHYDHFVQVERTCKFDEWHDRRAGSCARCPREAYCPTGTSSDQLIPRPGFFQSPTQPTQFMKCTVPIACAGIRVAGSCPAGVDDIIIQATHRECASFCLHSIGSIFFKLLSGQCRCMHVDDTTLTCDMNDPIFRTDGRTCSTDLGYVAHSTLCSTCATGYMNGWNPGRCLECVDVVIMDVMVPLVVCIAIVLCIAYSTYKHRRAGFSTIISKHRTIVSIRILIGYMQANSIILSGKQIPELNWLLNTQTFSGSAGFDFLTGYHNTNCWIQNRIQPSVPVVYVKVFIWLAMPIIITCVVVVFEMITKPMSRWTDLHRGTHAIMIFTYLAYMSLLKSCISMFACRSVFSVPLLVADMNIKCTTDTHMRYQVIVAFIGSLWIVGIPVVVFVHMYKHRKHLQEAIQGDTDARKLFVVKLFSSFIEGYKAKFWYWECVLLIGKVILVILTSAISNDIEIVRDMVSVFMFMQMIIHSICVPFKSMTMNVLHMQSIAAVYVSASSDIFVFVLVVNCLCTLCLVASVLYNGYYWRKSLLVGTSTSTIVTVQHKQPDPIIAFEEHGEIEISEYNVAP